MFRIDLLPAQRGDCIWITYGTGDELHHVLIDGGPAETIETLVPELERRIRAIPGDRDRVELLVVTHIDADHIQGIVSLLSDHARVRLFRDIWFNGWKHHDPDEFLGGVDAERLTRPLLTDEVRWNRAFGGHAVVVPDETPLPTRTLAGGMTLTLLGPTPSQLTTLAPEYEKACIKAGVVAGSGAPIIRKGWLREDFLGGFDPVRLAAAKGSSDSSKPNKASITLIAEYDGARVLLLADAHAGPTAEALDRLGPGPHHFDAVKISHHGSRNNTSRQLCERIRSKNWLVSSNGATFGHPDGECLARIVVSQDRPVFHLNYVTDRVTDLIEGAGDTYSVEVPRRRPDGSVEEGISLSL
jgi:hypothetical protein